MKKDSKANKVDTSAATASGQFAYDGLDRVIHERARLGIMTALMSRAEGLVFGELKELCSLTDGNLSRHLQTLQEASLIEVWKGQRDNYPQTLVRLSDAGRQKFASYLSELQKVLEQVAMKPQPKQETDVETTRDMRPRMT